MALLTLWTWVWVSSGCWWGEGNGNPLQYSCLENPMNGGAWWAAVQWVAESWIQLSDFTFTFHFNALEKEVATHSFLPGESQGWGSLVGCCLWGCTESDTTERLSSSSSKSWVLVMDREAWRSAVHGVTKNRTQMSNWTEHGPLELTSLDLCLLNCKWGGWPTLQWVNRLYRALDLFLVAPPQLPLGTLRGAGPFIVSSLLLASPVIRQHRQKSHFFVTMMEFDGWSIRRRRRSLNNILNPSLLWEEKNSLPKTKHVSHSMINSVRSLWSSRFGKDVQIIIALSDQSGKEPLRDPQWEFPISWLSTEVG